MGGGFKWEGIVNGCKHTLKPVQFGIKMNDSSFYESILLLIISRNIIYKGGKTNMADAFLMIKNEMFTTTNGARDQTPHLVILITDGNSNMYQER